MFGLPDDSPDALLLRDQSTQMVHDILDKKLSEKEKRVVTLRFGLGGGRPKTLEETAQSAGVDVTRERVRQIEAKAIRKLRFGACSENEGHQDAKSLRDVWGDFG